MSVQAGIWNFDGAPVDNRLLAKVSKSLEEQGPDGEARYREDGLALMYRAFHTTAESRLETQPYRSQRGFLVTWDGRIDNRDDLVAQLAVPRNALVTDVAITAAAFDRWGVQCFQRIIGDWAISVWNPQEQEIVLAVDYIAVRHIFYYAKKDLLWWCTDLNTIVLLSGDRFHIEDPYVAGYLANDPEAHLTPYHEIREVPPGQFVRVRGDASVSVQRYWSFNPKSRIRYTSDSEYEQHFFHLFRQSVRRRLRSDSPLLCELSGGLDSSSIICMADDIVASEGADSSRIDTLSYYDKTEPNGDDHIYFPKIERLRGREGIHIDVSALGSSPADLRCSEFFAMPGYTGAGGLVEATRAEAVRKAGYRAVLSGIGGDEFLGGKPDPSALLGDLIMQLRPAELVRELVSWSLAKRRPLAHLLCHVVLELLPPEIAQYALKQAQVEVWIRREFAKRCKLAIRQLDVDEHFGFFLPSRRAYAAGVVMMGRKLAKAVPPRLAMEEFRYPYLDRDLIEFILSIPANQLLRPGERRSLMRRSLAGIVPDEILTRRTKQFGARTPIATLDKNWKQLQHSFQSSFSSQLGYIDQGRFLETLKAARVGKTVHITRLQRTVSLEFWLRDLMDRGLLAMSQLPSSPLSPLNGEKQELEYITAFQHSS